MHRSPRQEIEPRLAAFYRLAVVRAERHMVDEPATVPLPPECPWTLDALLGEGDAALRGAEKGDEAILNR